MCGSCVYLHPNVIEDDTLNIDDIYACIHYSQYETISKKMPHHVSNEHVYTFYCLRDQALSRSFLHTQELLGLYRV